MTSQETEKPADSRGDVLMMDELRLQLGQHPWLTHVQLLKEVGSTNDLALEAGRRGAVEGSVWAADRQTKGRGRYGRAWESAHPLGLWMTVLLRPDWLAQAPPRLTLVASVAAARAVEKTISRACSIKWPNDLVVDGRKLGGILIETALDLEGRLFAAVGIGVNVHQQENDFSDAVRGKAISLIQAAEKEDSVKRITLLMHLLQELERTCRQDVEEVILEWKARCQSLGGLVRVQEDARLIEGVLVDIDHDGAALIRLSSGYVERIASGEIIHVSPTTQ